MNETLSTIQHLQDELDLLRNQNQQLQDELTSLNKSDQQLQFTQFTVDSSSTPILWVRRDAKMVYANDAALKQSGHTRDELLTMTVHDLNPHFSKEFWSEWLEKIKQAKTLTFETQHIHKDGHLIDVEVTTNLLRFKGKEYLFAFCSDISKRKSVEAEREKMLVALKESESRYRHIVEDQTDFVVRWLPSGQCIFANQAYCGYIDRTLEEIINTSFFSLVAIHDLDSFKQKIESLSLNEPSFSEEYQITRPDGTLAWNEWTVRALFDTQDQLTEYQSVGRDVTGKKKAEQKTREALIATSRMSLLSEREKEVLNLVVSGNSNKVTARELHITERTVEKHRASVMQKLNVSSAAELVRVALIAEHSSA